MSAIEIRKMEQLIHNAGICGEEQKFGKNAFLKGLWKKNVFVTLRKCIHLS